MEKICFYFLPFILFWLYHFQVGSVVSVISLTTDQSTLLAFKSHVSIFEPQNILKDNWSTSVSVCHWIGVSCGTRHRRVVALDLSNMGLGGTIPPHLGNLSFLVSLNLSHNNFNGHLPIELVQLHRMKFVDLTYNYFSGEIPSWFEDLPRLINLGLSSNNFTGIIPYALFNMSNIRILRMSQNQLSGIIPLAIYNLSSLQQIDLSFNSLSGTLPDDMCNFLTKLEWLSFSSNKLYGQLPSSLGKCSELQILGLSINKFTGRIPRDIGNLTKLKELALAATNLRGEIPWEFGKLMSLELFTAANIGLCGPIPPTIFNISSLKEIYLGHNILSGEIPNQIGNLDNLVRLSMGFNNLTGSIPSTIFNISTIKGVAVHFNNLSGHLPSSMGLWVPNLERLYLSGNGLSGIIPNSISNASNLRIIELQNNSFSGPIPSKLGNLRLLQSLSLSSNNLITESSTHEWSFLSSLANCKDLRVLDVGGNPLDIIFPTSIGNLSVSLEEFYAYDCKIKGHIPEEVGNLSSLIKLSLYDNDLIGPIPTTIRRLQKLQGLYLYGNNLQGFIPYDLCHLKMLDQLLLSYNKLHGQIPICFSNLTSLRLLILDSNKLSSTLPSTLWSLTYILDVHLSLNSLSGSLPVEVGNLKRLIAFDLSGNQLSGNLPSSLGGLKDLQYLWLEDNGLQGPIPQSFGDLISLVALDLSHNILSGVIPKSMEALTSLKQINVSFNRLEGEIPTEGPFKNFSTQSFLGNNALCGSPRLQVPSCKNNTFQRAKTTTSSLFLKYIFPIIASITLALALGIIFIRRQKQNVNMLNQESLLPLPEWRRISSLELQRATNGFSESNLLGTGGFGSVYRGSLFDGINVAIKVFNLELEGAYRSFDVECEIIRNIRHRNLVKIISSCCNLDFKALVLEFIPNGNLEKWLYSHNCFLDILQRLDIMIDVASALEYLHHGNLTPVVHCDLKPSNVLLDEDMVAHVADFGIAKLFGEEESLKQTITMATIGYMAPEYGSVGIISTKSDVYSFGILLMETFTRKKPTDEIFVGDLSLRNWVKESLSHAIIEVVDANLLRREEQNFITKMNCISSVLGLALDCSADSLEERGNMKDVLTMLKKIREKLVTE